MSIARSPFPRPASPNDLVVDPGLPASTIYAWLQAATTLQWDGPVDFDSPRRLLRADGWVLKTSVWDRTADRGEADRVRVRSTRRGRLLGCWHPAKTFFSVRFRGYWYLGSATPWLDPIPDGDRVFPAWRTWHVFRALCFNRVLDVRRVNFGRDAKTGRIHYLDDEVYRWWGHGRVT